VNKKVRRLALRRVFSDKVRSGELKVLSELTLAEPKTRGFAEILKSLKVEGPALFVVGEVNANLALASRNLPRIEVVRASDVSVYHLLRYPDVFVCKSAMGALEGRMRDRGGGGHEEP